MNALVTGASGHLGANLIRTLLDRGWTVKALVHRDRRALEGIDIETVEGNILDPDSLVHAFAGTDIVFHLAARISVVSYDSDLVEEMNIAGVRNVVDACLKSGAKRLVHTSSFHAAVQEPLDETFDETRSLVSGKGYAPYNLTKAEGERIVTSALSRGLDAVIVVPSGIIGPYDFQPSHFGATILNIASKRLRILVDAGLDWVDARDVANGMVDVAEKAPKGEKYLLSGHRATLKELAKLIARYMDDSPSRICLPFSVAQACAPIASTFNRFAGNRQLFTPISLDELNSNQCLNHEKATRDLGYEPRPTAETIKDTLDWFRDNGYLSV